MSKEHEFPVWLSVRTDPQSCQRAPESAKAAIASGSDIAIHGRIGVSFWDPTATGAAAFARALAAFPAGKEVRVSVNSEGGAIKEGLGILHAIRNHGNVTVIVEGYAASIASVFVLAAKRRISPPGSLWMVHDPWAYTDATTSAELRQAADMLDAHREELVALYVQGTGRTEKEVRAAMGATTWFTSAQAVKWGLATESAGTAIAIASVPAPSRFPVPTPLLAPASAGAATSAAASAASDNHNKPTADSMEKIRTVLVKAGIIPDTAPATDAELAPLVEASLANITDARATAERDRDAARADAKKLRDDMASRLKMDAENAVSAAVTAGRIRDDAALRAKWVSAYIAAPDSTRAMLDGIEAKPDNPKPPRGTDNAALAGALANAQQTEDEAVKAYLAETDPVKRARLWDKHRAAIVAAAAK